MIKSFSFKNYKAFKEGKIGLKPITLLLGANSVGKSSILQFLSMTKQTFNTEKEYKSALKLNGEYVSLGENKNIFHNRNTTSPLEVTFEINGFNLQEIKNELENSIEEIQIIFENVFAFLTKNPIDFYKTRKNFGIERTIDYSNIFKRIKSLKTKINNKLTGKLDIEDALLRYGSSRYRRNTLNIYSKEKKKIVLDVKHYEKIHSLLENLPNIDDSDSILLSYHIIFKDNDLKIDKIEISHGGKIILGYRYERGKRHFLYSGVVEDEKFKGYASIFGNSVCLEKMNIISKESEEKKESNLFEETVYTRKIHRVEENVFVKTVFRIFKKVIRLVQSNFLVENINYVSPLRAFPKRYYFLDEANVSSSLNTINGNQLTEILQENKRVKGLVNDWLKKFQLKVDVEKLADVIHNIKINQHGLNLDITDVGFGLSQILPVIVQGFLSQDDSLTIIEQPEIHLHPKMQADLADLFIDIVKTKKENDVGKNILIETHSEYLLKRLRRRIAEGKISHNEVAIYFIYPKDEKNGSGKIENIQINETGAFEWPKDFYSDDLIDTIEFLKHQA